MQSARESGRRTTCLNNIKQIAAGLQQFHQANSRLPRGGAVNNPSADKSYKSDGSDDDQIYKFSYPGSWQLATLPFLDLGVLRDGFNLNASVATAPNNTLIQQAVSGFVCPSDPGASSPIRKMCGGNGFFGKDSKTGATLPSVQMAIWYAPSFGPSPSGRAGNFRKCDGCYLNTAITQGSFVNYCCFYKVSPNSNWGELGRGGSGAGMF
ncbi:MAG: DUF1559 domain-containing protein, partial [Planctomycetota bacterium]